MKRVVAIHDISCFGRCSLTVALPILSASGINCCVLPTAVLSTHTGFDGFTYRDLTKDILPITSHWKQLGLGFDALYSGFLGSIEQIDILDKVFAMFHTKESFLLVDPVMGDNGKLYKTFSPDFPKKMLKLCKQADLITPNLTEACLLLGEDYPTNYTYSNIERIIKKLAFLIGSSKQIVITGVQFQNKAEEIGVAVYNKNTIDYAMAKHIPSQYSGTGDIFASSLLSALLCNSNNNNLVASAKIAVEFVSASIRHTLEAGLNPSNGIYFEKELQWSKSSSCNS